MALNLGEEGSVSHTPGEEGRVSHTPGEKGSTGGGGEGVSHTRGGGEGVSHTRGGGEGVSHTRGALGEEGRVSHTPGGEGMVSHTGRRGACLTHQGRRGGGECGRCPNRCLGAPVVHTRGGEGGSHTRGGGEGGSHTRGGGEGGSHTKGWESECHTSGGEGVAVFLGEGRGGRSQCLCAISVCHSHERVTLELMNAIGWRVLSPPQAPGVWVRGWALAVVQLPFSGCVCLAALSSHDQSDSVVAQWKTQWPGMGPAGATDTIR